MHKTTEMCCKTKATGNPEQWGTLDENNVRLHKLSNARQKQVAASLAPASQLQTLIPSQPIDRVRLRIKNEAL